MAVLSVRHVTTYAYRRPVGFGEHRLLFRPRDSHHQRFLSAALDITPAPSDVHWIHDVFGNCVAIARFDAEAAELHVGTTIALDHTPEKSRASSPSPTPGPGRSLMPRRICRTSSR